MRDGQCGYETAHILSLLPLQTLLKSRLWLSPDLKRMRWAFLPDDVNFLVDRRIETQ